MRRSINSIVYLARRSRLQIIVGNLIEGIIILPRKQESLQDGSGELWGGYGPGSRMTVFLLVQSGLRVYVCCVCYNCEVNIHMCTQISTWM